MQLTMEMTEKTPTSPRTCHITGQIPPWMPKHLVDRCGGRISTRFSFSAGERLVLYKRKAESPSVWAEKHRVLRMSSIPGTWRHVFTPYLAPLMDAARWPGVQMIALCKAPQTAGSEAGFNLLGHAADHAPGPALVVFPDKDTAKDNSRDRILPMFEDSPRLRRHLTGSTNDESSIRINLRHMSIYLGWSGSVARLGNKPIRTLILDELDKYQDSRNEASSEALAEHRTTTWSGRCLIVKISTPTTETGPIWVAFTEECHARFDWWVACPVCGTLQLMKFDNIRWPDGVEDPEDVLRSDLVYYQCEHCDAHWDDAARDFAVRRGQWVERASGLELFTHLKTHRVSKIGFHIPAWISHFVSLAKVAHAFLKWKKSERLKDLKNFMNQFKAEAWAEQYAERDEDAILSLCDTRPRGVVPGPVEGRPQVAALVAGVDTQAKYFRYVIRAFGYGHEEESWLVQHGTAPTFAALDELLWRSVYRDPLGGVHKVKVAVIDAMGAPGRTKAVYAWCAKHRRALPYQGKQTVDGIIRYSHIDFFPDDKGAKIKIPGGITLRRVDTTFFKSDLAEKLGIKPGDPGTFWLHTNVKKLEGLVVPGGVLLDYAREMCAEVFNPETLVWENPKQRANHFWDCEIMALVGAWELGLRNKRPPKSTPDPVTRPQSAPPKSRTVPRGASAADRLASMRNRR